MLPSENYHNLVNEYSEILLRDLSFLRWRDWEPMITKIMDTLGIYSLEGMGLTGAIKDPGKDIVEFLISGWLRRKGKLWENLFYLSEINESTPYEEYTIYRIHIKSPGEVVTELSGREVYDNYEIIKKIFWSPEYQNLRTLDGFEIKLK